MEFSSTHKNNYVCQVQTLQVTWDPAKKSNRCMDSQTLIRQAKILLNPILRFLKLFRINSFKFYMFWFDFCAEATLVILDCFDVQCSRMFKCSDSYCIPLKRLSDHLWDCRDEMDELTYGCMNGISLISPVNGVKPPGTNCNKRFFYGFQSIWVI